MRNENGESIESAPHPKQQLRVKLDKPLDAGMIIRRKE